MHSAKRLVSAALIFACGAGLHADPAGAQATRTWVSGVGDDVNPCSRTAPCKTFAGAISKTAAGGEINCLDPGGFGSVTITKAMAIVCDHIGGSVLSGAAGIVVNAGAADTIFLSGIDMLGTGEATTGIRFIAGGALHVRNSSIRMFNAAGGAGISFKPSGAALLTVTNTVIADNANGIILEPAGGEATAAIDQSSIVHNAGSGIGASGAVSARVASSTIAGNGTGVAPQGSATISSFGDNRLHGNRQDGAFSGSVARQ